MSGETVVLFDPHGRHLPGGKGELGMRATFTDGLAERFPGLMDPLLAPLARLHDAQGAAAGGGNGRCAASICRDRPTEATLFRLPLRTEAQARTSELSDRAVTADEVRHLLEQMCEGNGLGELLLFTQHLTSVECCVMQRCAKSGGEGEGGGGGEGGVHSIVTSARRTWQRHAGRLGSPSRAG